MSFFSYDCTWHAYIKAWKRINTMRKLKFELDGNSFEIIYFTFIRPLLEYANVVWDNCIQYEKLELDKIQNEAARIVTGTTKQTGLFTSFMTILNVKLWDKDVEKVNLSSFSKCLMIFHLPISLLLLHLL